MAMLAFDRDKLRANHAELERRMAGHGVEWGVVTKLLCGEETYLREVLALGPSQVLDSRTSNLATVKALDPNVQTIYIKPPAPGNAEDVVRYANVSFNTELTTLRALDEEAERQGKRHGVVVMVEMGDLREGVMRERLLDFMGEALAFEHLDVKGLGTNFNCLNGTLPSEDKLIQLGLFRELVELEHGVDLAWVSGGTSVTLPMLLDGRVPAAVNHFRIGETLFFGRNLVDGSTFDGMHDDVFEFHAEVIEVAEKPRDPTGPFGEDPFGGRYETAASDEGGASAAADELDAAASAADGATAGDGAAAGAGGAPGEDAVEEDSAIVRRAILDVGYLDIDPDYLVTDERGVELVDVSSDMMVVDVTDRVSTTRVGDRIRFALRYMGALTLLNSTYVDKEVVGTGAPVGASASTPAPAQAVSGD